MVLLKVIPIQHWLWPLTYMVATNAWPLVKLAHEPSSIAYDGGPQHKFKQKPCAYKGEEHVPLLPLGQLQG